MTVNGSPKFFEVSNFAYNYKTYKDIKNLKIEDEITLSYDSIYNFYIPYSLNYGLGVYSKDFYGEQRDIYSEFTEMFDLLHGFSNGTVSKEEVNNFLKNYYYKKLTSLFREAPIADEEPLTIETQGKKPTKVYPKLVEKLDGRGGFFGSPWTLLSTFANNGKYYGNTKLNFYKTEIKVSDNYQKTTIKFFTKKEDFVKCFGYDFNRYYKMIDLSKIGSSEEVAKLSKTIEEMYKKQFACIKPTFQFKKNIYDISRPSNWQSSRRNFEVEFATAEVENTDSNYKPITNASGYVIGLDGLRLNTPEEIKARLEESSDIIITVVDTTITPGLRLNADKDFFKDMNEDEESNIYGYLTVKKLTQKFIDNYISKCYSAGWIEKDSEGEPTEYNSFGDDRNINITSINKAVTEDNYENYYNSVIAEDKIHDEEVAQFNDVGRVLTDNGYVQFDKTKTLEDQGLTPIYKKVPENKVYLSHLDNKLVSVATFIDEHNDSKRIINDDVKVYYNSSGKLCVEIPSSRIHTGNITKVRLFFKSLYINIATRSIFSFASFGEFKFAFSNKAIAGTTVSTMHQTNRFFKSARVIGQKVTSRFSTSRIFVYGSKIGKLLTRIRAVFTNKTSYFLFKSSGSEVHSRNSIRSIVYHSIRIAKKAITSSPNFVLKKITKAIYAKLNNITSKALITTPTKYTSVNILEKLRFEVIKGISAAVKFILFFKKEDIESFLTILWFDFGYTKYYRPNEERKEVTIYDKFFTNANITTTDYRTLEFNYLTSSPKVIITEMVDTDGDENTPKEETPGYTICIPWWKFELNENGNNYLYPDPETAGSWKRVWESPRQGFWFVVKKEIEAIKKDAAKLKVCISSKIAKLLRTITTSLSSSTYLQVVKFDIKNPTVGSTLGRGMLEEKTIGQSEAAFTVYVPASSSNVGAQSSNSDVENHLYTASEAELLGYGIYVPASICMLNKPAIVSAGTAGNISQSGNILR